MKKLLIGLVAVLVLVVAALFVAPPLLGNSVIKSQVVAAVKEATGRDVEIGDLSLAVLPAITVSLRDLRLANAEGMPSPDMLTLDELDLELALFPLIGKKVMVERLTVSGLSANLEVDEAGRANWVFPSDGAAVQAEERAEGDGGAPIADLRLGDVRVENAQVAYRDMTSGQTIAAEDIALTAELADIASELALTGGLVVNGKPVDIDVSVDTPQALMAGDPAKIAAAVTSELITLDSDLELAQAPQPAVDGGATVEIASVGQLLAWLEQPLPADQPDPGPLRLSATFATEGARVLLQEAVLEGESLDLKADGSFESLDGVNKVALNVESGVLDIDRYLPPPADVPADVPADAPAANDQPAQDDGAPRGSPIEAIPDEPFDLRALRETEADVTVAMAGIKAAGYEVGALALTVKSAGGRLQLDLSQLALYGGGVTGTLALDGSGEGLGVDADFALDEVDLGAVAAVAAAGDAPVAGIASGRLTASGAGASPRALVQDLKGGLVFKLGEVDMADAAAGTVSGVDLTVDLPGLAQPPSLAGEVVYNQRKVSLDVGLDPLDKVLAEDSFALQAKVGSELMTLDYDGRVQQRPLPGLDGRLTFASPSLGALAAWLGQPLPDGQPDPGPLEIDARLAADGRTAAIESASISGKAVEATASGSYDGSGEILQFDGRLDVARLDLNAYLPPPSDADAEAAAAPADAGEGWSDEPIGAFAELGKAEGQVEVTLADVVYREVQLQAAAAQVALAGGVLTADVSEVTLSPGQVTASAVVDASGDTAEISYEATVEGVESNPFLTSFANTDILSGKLNFSTKGSARGNTQKDIVASLNGDGRFAFLDGAIEGFDLAGTLRNVGQLGMASGGETPKTDFSELSGSFTITDGVLDNRDLTMLAPLVRVAGAGQVPLPPRTLDYKVEAKLVASLEGQGGSDALAGLPIPVHAHGPWDRLSYEIDYESMFEAAAADPARLVNLPADLAEKASQFGVNLPIPGLGDGEGDGLKKLLEGATGAGEGGEGGESGGGLGGVVEGLLGGKKAEEPQGDEGASDEGASDDGAQSQEDEPKVPDLGKELKGLFD